jgi:hypothetical protein
MANIKRRAAYDARDAYNTISVESGPFAGKSMRVRSGSKLAIDPGAKASHQKAFGELPVFIARGTAEPKLTVDDLLERDSSAIRQFVGGIGGAPFTWTTVFSRPGFPNRTLTCRGCEVSGGLGIDLDENGAKGKLECLVMDVLEDGVSIYAKRVVA